jgi:hypothetical protein
MEHKTCSKAKHWALAVGLGLSLCQAAWAYEVKNLSFSLTFSNVWSATPALGSASALAPYQTDTSAVALNAGGLNGVAFMGLFATQETLSAGVMPSTLSSAVSGAVLTKTKDSSATYGRYAFFITDYNYDSLPPQNFGGVPFPTKGKFRLYSTQVGGHVFSLATFSLLSSAAILPHPDIEAALRTLIITPNGISLSVRPTMKAPHSRHRLGAGIEFTRQGGFQGYSLSGRRLSAQSPRSLPLVTSTAQN